MIHRVEDIEAAGAFRRLTFFTVIATAVAACLILCLTSTAAANESRTTKLPGGLERTTYEVGPLNVTPGQNRITYNPIVGEDRPAVDGWITRIKPNLVRADGSVPLSSKVMFHHGVWLNMSRDDPTSGTPERFYATGEEKTNMELPDGYGYRYENSDGWTLNHMIHNLTPDPMVLYITYTVDFIPDTAPEAGAIRQARPIWMDVDNGSIYPVFDVHRGEGGRDGEFTYPEDADNPYPGGHQKNEWTVDHDGTLIGTTGHVHSGGLSTDLYLKRDGASYAGKSCKAPRTHAGKRKNLGKRMRAINRKMKKVRKSKQPSRAKLRKLKKQKAAKSKQQSRLKKKDRAAKSKYKSCLNRQPSVEGNRAHLFTSTAHYFEPAGPVSWDVAMVSTKPDWRVAVKAGDTLDLQTTYETKRASWYESMGINVVWMTDETDGDNPFKTKVDGKGVLNHGHYAENNDHGGVGGKSVVGPNPAKLPNGPFATGSFNIGPGFTYEQGDFRLPGEAGRPPVVKKGDSFTFALDAGDADKEIWHSLTSCKSPCNKSTGIAYPIADGDFQFDSGQLGNGGPPTVGRTTWTTPTNLPVGTHTYFCRIHPLMRGAFRVVK